MWSMLIMLSCFIGCVQSQSMYNILIEGGLCILVKTLHFSLINILPLSLSKYIICNLDEKSKIVTLIFNLWCFVYLNVYIVYNVSFMLIVIKLLWYDTKNIKGGNRWIFIWWRQIFQPVKLRSVVGMSVTASTSLFIYL